MSAEYAETAVLVAVMEGATGEEGPTVAAELGEQAITPTLITLGYTYPQ